jgi:thiamine pyrophosphokinase
MSCFEQFFHQYPVLNIIYTGGEEPSQGMIEPFFNRGTYHVAADQGYHVCQKLNFSPDILIGDLDSLSYNNGKINNSIDSKTQQLVYPKDKDYTDTELAINHVLSINQDPIILIGGGGFQSDHFLSNLITVLKTPQIKLWITARELIIPLDSTLHIKQAINLRLSIFSFINSIVSSTGLKWELENYAISNTQMTISNMCTNNHIEVNVLFGKVFVLLYPEKNDLNNLDLYYV